MCHEKEHSSKAQEVVTDCGKSGMDFWGGVGSVGVISFKQLSDALA